MPLSRPACSTLHAGWRPAAGFHLRAQSRGLKDLKGTEHGHGSAVASAPSFHIHGRL